MRSHWFLPETPDVLGTLAAQADVTVRRDRRVRRVGAW